MPEEPKKPADEIKVSDRRSFTTTGEKRMPDQPKTEPAPKPAPSPGPAPSGPEDEGEIGGIDFDSFVRYLAQVALQQMAGSRDHATGEVIAGLEEAKQTIEILAMLKSKTRGNLTPRETGTLEDLLYHLRIEFSRRASRRP
jgi:hypothetical protein